MPGLDGVRAVAVLITVLFHAGAISGGFLGVDVFMVLSGYLITRLLLEEHAAAGRIDVRAFWMRRLRRLVPPLALMLAGYVVVVIGLDVAGVTTEWSVELRSIVASQLWIANWALAFGADITPTLRHLWSLAVEEQFYLLWPPVLLLLLRRSPRWRLGVTVAAMGLSISTLALDGGFARHYYGSDFRAHQLLAGCLLAQVQHAGGTRSVESGSQWWRIGGCVGGAFVVWRSLVEGWRQTDLGTTGLMVTAASVLVVAVCALDAEAPLTKLMSSEPLRWIGARSYEIYLVHYPLCRWVEFHGLRSPATTAAILLASIALGDGLRRGHRIVLARFDRRRRRGPGRSREGARVGEPIPAPA